MRRRLVSAGAWVRTAFTDLHGKVRINRGGVAAAPQRTLDWLRKNELPTGGIRVHSAHPHAYPEVTGYLVKTLLQYGDREFAHRLVRWLIAIQREDGSFTGPDDGVSYVFDTGQALRGLLSGIEIEPLAEESALRAADYLRTQMRDHGRGGFGDRYDGSVPESVHLYVLPPLFEAAAVLRNSVYREAADNCLKYYLVHGDALRVGDLTHFLSYQLEALIDLGHANLALPILKQLQDVQKTNGSVRGVIGKPWVCTPGLAQLSICWLKTGHWEPAEKAMTWLDTIMARSGGFQGSYGPGASYFPEVELSWAAKFYLDAHLLRVLSFMERNAAVFPDEIPTEDGRLRAVLSAVRPGHRVVEVGCGKGRFLKAIQSLVPDTQCTGVDISPIMLSHLAAGMSKIEGSLERIPCPEDSFDVVFSVEAIEHSSNLDAAVQELIRIAKPGGWVIILDKQKSAWGRLSCPPWERWPEIKHLTELLNRGCDHVATETVGYDGRGPDGLMVAWRGQKRSRLTGLQWNATLVAPATQSALVTRLRGNHLSAWGLELLLATHHGERVLEIGSGTGEISLALALAGREVTVLDISAESLQFTQKCARAIGVQLEVVLADATQPLPLPENDFDCIWSSGLLEHFTPEERHKMLCDWRRVTRAHVITLVPNSASVAYRAGKALQERTGQWAYGLEVPILSLRQEFAEAGLRVVKEFTIDARHSLNFLPAGHALRLALSAWMDTLSHEELLDCNQGYLLITLGTKV